MFAQKYWLLMNNLKLIEQFCLKDDLSTYDPYDIWKTPLGIKVKHYYYKNKYLGLFPAGALTIYDLYINNSIRLGYKKQEYPIVRALAALILLNLYEKEPKEIYLEYAKKHICWLISKAIYTNNGMAWGLNFKHVISEKLIYDINEPFSTISVYPLEAIIKLYSLIKDSSLLYYLRKIYNFFDKDIKIMVSDKRGIATSYGTFKDRIVINAISYTMYALAILLNFDFAENDYLINKIKMTYNYIINKQNKNGSWFYSPEGTSFIDTFHSAIILKNLIKCSNIVQLENSQNYIQKGYDFLNNEHFNSSMGLYTRFSISNKVSLIKYDLYDNAEMLNLSILLNDMKRANNLYNNIEKIFFKNSDIYSCIDIFGIKKNSNMLRWAIMPYIYSKILLDCANE